MHEWLKILADNEVGMEKSLKYSKKETSYARTLKELTKREKL